MRILHIIDDEKFINFCKNTFDLSYLDNFYLESGHISTSFLNKYNIELIVIHYLKEKEVDFFCENQINIPKVWMFWGADGFSLPLFYNKFLDKDSLLALNKIRLKSGPISYLKHFVKEYFNRFWNNSDSVKRKIDFINTLKFIVPIVPGDYSLLREQYSIKTPSWNFNYVINLEGNVENKYKENIILGNSSSITNNHISILKTLNKIELGQRKVYVPLSYGDEAYRLYITKFIKSLNNNNIIPITDFLPYAEYSKIINSCDIMIMNHKRQQALGNVVLGLLNGCTIFLDRSSTLYEYLRNNGFMIRDIAEIVNLEHLNFNEKKNNAELARIIFGKENQLKSVELMLKNIL